MSAAVAIAAPPPPPPPPSTLTPITERHPSPRHSAAIAKSAGGTASAPPTMEPIAERVRSAASPIAGDFAHPAPVERASSSGKTSPNAIRNAPPPAIKVKREPGSPAIMSARPRPKRLDLSSSTVNRGGPQTARPSAPLTSRESAGLAIQDVGLACLSPGFQTHDPAMREQLQRSLDVRDQQRQIIEARQKGIKPGSSHDSAEGSQTQDNTPFGVQVRTPGTSRRKGPPPGLSIHAPSASAFGNDRVIQSAPMHQTFTGLRPGEHPFTRHVQHGPSGLSQTSHIHHVPATQTNNRLPPIAHVFANDHLDAPRGYNPDLPSPSIHGPPPLPSSGFPPSQHAVPPLSARGPEFRSADEAMQGLSGGRDDLMPKVVHYGGVQPPTPPSPLHHHHHMHPQHHHHPSQHPQPQSTAGATQSAFSAGNGYAPHTATSATFLPSDGFPRPDILARTSSMNGRRRGREEYEADNGSPPSSFRHSEAKRATFAVRGDDGEEQDWRAGMGGAAKRDEFLRLCERAWDLFHS